MGPPAIILDKSVYLVIVHRFLEFDDTVGNVSKQYIFSFHIGGNTERDSVVYFTHAGRTEKDGGLLVAYTI